MVEGIYVVMKVSKTRVLACAGVYKRTDEGKEAFLRFISSLIIK